MTIGPIKITNPQDVRRALIDRQTIARYEDEVPLLNCPGCGLLVPDFDGFGIVAHLDPDESAQLEDFPPGCGYCTHPTADGNADGKMVCNLCGALEGTEEWQTRRGRRNPKF